jgi:FkbM family methyltransferase
VRTGLSLREKDGGIPRLAWSPGFQVFETSGARHQVLSIGHSSLFFHCFCLERAAGVAARVRFFYLCCDPSWRVAGRFLVHGARVLAFEPNPECHRGFRAWCAANRVVCELEAVAVGERAGTAVLAVPEGRTYLGSTNPHVRRRWPEATVRTLTVTQVALDDVVKEQLVFGLYGAGSRIYAWVNGPEPGSRAWQIREFRKDWNACGRFASKRRHASCWPGSPSRHGSTRQVRNARKKEYDARMQQERAESQASLNNFEAESAARHARHEADELACLQNPDWPDVQIQSLKVEIAEADKTKPARFPWLRDTPSPR